MFNKNTVSDYGYYPTHRVVINSVFFAFYKDYADSKRHYLRSLLIDPFNAQTALCAHFLALLYQWNEICQMSLSIERKHIHTKTKVRYTRIPIFSLPRFSNLPITRTQRRFSSPSRAIKFYTISRTDQIFKPIFFCLECSKNWYSTVIWKLTCSY